jgi:hypothetical protein
MVDREGGTAAARIPADRPVVTLVIVTGYDDGTVACTGSELVIRRYYFPFGAKRIPYSAIREVRRVPLGALGKWRIAGSGDFVHWFNFDPHRPRKDVALVVDLGGRVKPVVTPDDPGQVVDALTASGVNVTGGSGPGPY